MIRFRCPNPTCRKPLSASDESVGRMRKCPTCGTAFKVPETSTRASSAKSFKEPFPVRHAPGVQQRQVRVRPTQTSRPPPPLASPIAPTPQTTSPTAAAGRPLPIPLARPPPPRHKHEERGAAATQCPRLKYAIGLVRGKALAIRYSLKKWGEAHSPDTKLVVCFAPLCAAVMCSVVLWLGFAGKLGFCVALLTLTMGAVYATVSGSAFFTHTSSTRVRGILAELCQKQANLRLSLARVGADVREQKRKAQARKYDDRLEKLRVKKELKAAARLQRLEQQRGEEIARRRAAELRVCCPRCGSTQIQAGQTGYDTGCGSLGCCLLGPLGLILGLIGSSKVVCTCLACGHKFRPGRGGMIGK